MSDAALGPLFEPPQDPSYLWLVGLAVALAAIALAAVGLVRGRLPATLWLPALLLPLASYALSYLFVLEESKHVAFCGSCHETMSPLVAALEDADGTLSSTHWQRGAVSRRDACYVCHSGYGIWGAFDAKRAGLGHMLHTVTGRFELPIRSQGFDVRSCLGCHAEATPFRAAEAHRDLELQRQLLAGELGCAGLCHPPAHPESALRGVAGLAPEVGR